MRKHYYLPATRRACLRFRSFESRSSSSIVRVLVSSAFLSNVTRGYYVYYQRVRRHSEVRRKIFGFAPLREVNYGDFMGLVLYTLPTFFLLFPPAVVTILSAELLVRISARASRNNSALGGHLNLIVSPAV